MTIAVDGAQAHPESAGAEKPAAPAGEKPAAAAPEGAKPTGEEKPAAAAAVAAPPTKEGEKPAAEGAPAKYALTVADDAKAYAEDGALTQLETIARKNNWTNDQAQAALDNYLEDAKATSARYEAQTKADPDYGGEKLDETKKYARAAILAIRPEGHPRRESFLRFLNSGGAGNHIEAISFLADLGKRIGEDGAVGGRSSAGVKSAEDTLYDHPTSKG